MNWNRFGKNTVIVCWVLTLLFLVVSGNISLFIKKGYTFLPVLGALILTLIFVSRLRHPEEEAPENPWVYILFLFPLIFALGVRPESLGGFSALRKGLVTGGVSLSEGARAELLNRLQETRAYQHLNLKEILALTEEEPFPSGLKVRTEGMLVETKNQKVSHYLVRFRIICCAADAILLAIPVQMPEGIEAAGQWLSVCGRLSTGPLIEADEVSTIPSPTNPYLH